MKTFLPYLLRIAAGFALLWGGILSAQPVNDDLCNASPLTVGATCNGMTTGDNTGATTQTNEPNPSCFAGANPTVWFSFVGPASGRVRVSTNYNLGSNLDTEIAMYALNSGQCSNFSDLTLIACVQDDNNPPQIYNSTIEEAPVVPGETYYLQVSGWNNSQGTFCLTVEELPLPSPLPQANDTLCNAISLQVDSSCNGATNGNNLNALFEVGENLGNCTAFNNTVWYSFVAPVSGAVEITTDVNVGGSNTDTEITLFALPGGNCGQPSDLFEVACASGNGSNGSSIDTTRLTAGSTYYVAVSGGASGGSFCIEVKSAGGINYPANDNLCDAIPLTVGASCTTNFSNTNATIEVGEPIPNCFVGGANSVWFSFEGTNSGAASISTDIDSMATNDDTEIAVYALPGGNCSDLFDLVELACSQDNGSVLPFNSFIEGVAVDSGATYYVQVSGYNGAEGSFCIEVEEAFTPVNDDVCDAVALPVDGSINDFFNISATLEASEATDIVVPIGNGEGNRAWFESSLRSTTWHTFVAPATGSVRIDLCNDGNGTTDFDTQVAVFQADSCEDLANFTFLGGNDDDPIGCTSGQNRFSSILDLSCLTAGETYYILVDGYQEQSGFYSISISELSNQALELTFDTESPTCADDLDGRLSVSVSGGSEPYTYEWSTGDSLPLLDSVGLGTYTLMVRDFCDSTTVGQASLLPPPSLRVFSFSDPTLCNGDSSGQVAALVNGGRPPYTFQWNNGDTLSSLLDVPAGNYTLTLRDACDTLRTFSRSVEEPQSLSIEAGEDFLLCEGSPSLIELGNQLSVQGGARGFSERAYGFDIGGSQGLFRHAVRRRDPLTSILGPTGNFNGADFVEDQLFVIQVDSNQLFRYDTAFAQLNKVGDLPPSGDQRWVGLSYDGSRSKLFALAAGADSSSLYEVNPSSASATFVGNIEVDAPIWLAIDDTGAMFILDVSLDELFQVDTTTLEANSLGSVGFNANFLQDADFDPATGLLYLAAFNEDSNRAEYRVIALNEGPNSTYLGSIPGAQAVQAYAIQNLGPANTPNAYTYDWEPELGFMDPADTALANPIISYAGNATYLVRVEDACGQVSVDSLVVGSSEGLNIDSVQISGNTTSAFVVGGIPPYEYQWSSGDSTANVVNLDPGPYTLIVRDQAGCTDSISFDIISSMDPEANLADIRLYPNPNPGMFHLSVRLGSPESLTLKVYGMDGQLIHREQIPTRDRIEKGIDLSHLAKGVYRLTLSSEQSFISRSFMVK